MQQQVLEKIDSRDLVVYSVWVPKQGGEERHVSEAAGLVPDRRVSHYWDGGEVLGKAYQRMQGLPVEAWDVYYLFGPEVRWKENDPPRPDFWMHQLRGVTQAPRLDGDALAQEVRALLRKRTAYQPSGEGSQSRLR